MKPSGEPLHKPRCNGQWTESRFRSFVVSALRRASSRWAPKYTCKKQARTARNSYRCAQCKGIFGNSEVHVDHIQPVVDPIQGFVSWDQFIERLFVEIDGYRLLCKECHSKVTANQRELRKQNKR